MSGNNVFILQRCSWNWDTSDIDFIAAYNDPNEAIAHFEYLKSQNKFLASQENSGPSTIDPSDFRWVSYHTQKFGASCSLEIQRYPLLDKFIIPDED